MGNGIRNLITKLKCLFSHKWKVKILSEDRERFSISWFGNTPKYHHSTCYIMKRECERCKKVEYYVDGLDNDEVETLYPTKEVLEYKIKQRGLDE